MINGESSNTQKPIIKLNNVSVVWDIGKSNETWGLRDVSIEIFPDEYVILFGPSGSGKSTMLYLIAGLLRPSKGDVVVGGKNVAELPEKEIINFHRSLVGIIFQAFYLIPSLNVRDNILLPQIFAGKEQGERTERLTSLTKRFQLEHLLKNRTNQLSGGQQQRIAVARALVNDPSIVLADEPVGNLDTKNAEITMQLLDELNSKDRKTVILVTHDPRYLPFAHRVFYIKDGQVIKETVNHKKSMRGKKSQDSSLMEKITEMYPYANEIELKSKLILNQILLTMSLDEQQMIEKIVIEYISGNIKSDELLDRLEKVGTAGVAALYEGSAKKLAKKITDLVDEMNFITTKSDDASKPQHPLSEKVISIRKFLLDQYEGSLKLEEVTQLDKILLARLKGELDAVNFDIMLDKPVKDGGVGLNRRTARNFSREVELIMISQENK